MHESECNKNLAPLGVKFIGVKFDRIGMNIFAEIKSTIELFKKVNEEAPDLIISIGIKMAVYSGLTVIFTKTGKFFPLINGRGSIFQIKGIKYVLVKSIVFQLMKIIFNRCHFAFFQNNDDMNLFIDKGLIKKEKGIVVNGSGVNID
jgi:hypothetical protein